jgi:hypothetical protein
MAVFEGMGPADFGLVVTSDEELVRRERRRGWGGGAP